MKAFETPEEKRARRLAKKEAKERKKREKMGWGEEYMGYTNTDNPFGDNNLLGTFIWNKVGPGRRPARGPGGSLPPGVSSLRTRAHEPRPLGPLRGLCVARPRRGSGYRCSVVPVANTSFSTKVTHGPLPARPALRL